MRYPGMPWGMWALFRPSFQKNLTTVLGLSEQAAAQITAHAHKSYKQLIAKVPEFEPEDQFKMNLVNAAMLAAFLLQLDPKPPLGQLTLYYEKSMMTPLVCWFFRQSGKQKFSKKDIRTLKANAALRAADRNPYSWNMEFYEYEDGSGYEARFTACGICALMRELGLEAQTPALCHLDYAMTKASGTAEFVRQFTLATGGPYCDCGYVKIDKMEK